MSIPSSASEDATNAIIQTAGDNSCRMGGDGWYSVIERDFPMYLDVVTGRRSFRLTIVGLRSSRLDIVVFLRSQRSMVKATGEESGKLTITVRHSFNMKSRAVLHTAELERSKFLE